MGCEPELLKKEAMPMSARKLDLPKGVPPLTSLYMYIAGSCNLACRHCWISPTYEPDNSKGQFLELEYIKKAVTEAKPLGLSSVKLTGGEPTLHPQFRKIVEYLDNENINILIETNGTLVDFKLAGYLKSKKWVTFISVSLDGATAETHENLRGVSGSFDRTVAGIKNLVSAGFRPQMICTLNRGNINEIEAIIDLAENLGCGSIKFNHIQVMGRGENLIATQGLQLLEILEVYKHITNEIGRQNKIPIFFDIPHAFLPIRKILKNNLAKCAINNVLGILASGDLALCGIGVTSPELIYGHIKTNEIGNIWTENTALLRLREAIPFQFEGICGNCIHQFTCLGSCVANNFHRTGKLNAPFFFCQQADEMGIFPESRKRISRLKGEKYDKKNKNDKL
jgi:SynChlorMet cassette radical SAM/SPASM protein ScmF